MSAVNEDIVREYFESKGFLVRQLKKHQVTARPKQTDEEVDLIAFNPRVTAQVIPDRLLWSGSELGHISRAIIAIHAWHTERFSPAVLKTSPEIFRLVEKRVIEKAGRMLGEGSAVKILILPEFPTSGSLRTGALDILKQRGIDGVLLFRTMLLELADYVDVNRNYEKSDILQMIRILKNYDLLKDAQMDLFRRKRKRPKSPEKAS